MLYGLRFGKISPLLFSIKALSSSSSSSTTTNLQRLNPQPQKLVTLLQKHSSNRHLTKQVHSHIVTSHPRLAQNNFLLLFNNLLRCYSHGDFPHEALSFYKYFLHFSSPSFDSFTFSFLIHACSNLNSVPTGSQLHALTFKVGFQSHVYVQTALVNLYVSCGFLHEAHHVFDEMREKNSVMWNVMITGLTKWGEFKDALSLFDRMPSRTVVSWTAVIDAYTRMNRHGEAVALFRRMVSDDNIQPSEITLLAIIPAVSNLGALKICQSIHAYGEKRGFNASDIRVTNSILDSYSKCGCIQSASRFFEGMSSGRKNLVSWTSMISGFAMHGMGEEAVESFRKMEEVGVKPNRVTLLSVLNGCSHGGLVEEGLEFFKKMIMEYEITPNIKHYGCIIDMLGRTGRLKEAENIALEVPSEMANVVIWRTLLGACSFHDNIEIGERVTKKIMEMERGYGGDYVLMSNIFASVGRYKDCEEFRRLLDERKAYKVPGHSFV
ncbi:pentatricopeptide repeat-containing protein At1g09220, mitochondrial [Humulus lupulus]|uniref:pentatricopeptide repeat-containing protein At1g09220, mitochondrial n=1 Tax=Humulus lupulus TaxID=3486 RepID=UPI002B40D6FA|nr:pentatricopeptide repeat-containing protein At1g09220, mitochondrial [Humulus lupulus]